jgi:hypothetical protein
MFLSSCTIGGLFRRFQVHAVGWVVRVLRFVVACDNKSSLCGHIANLVEERQH